MVQKKLAIPHTLASQVANGGTFNVPYPSGYTQADFVETQEASTSVMGAQHNDLAVVIDTNYATVTWDKTTTLPAGTELTIGLTLVSEVPNDMQDTIANVAEAEDAGDLAATADVAALTASTAAAAITDAGTPSTTVLVDVTGAHDQTILNNNFATCIQATKEVETKHNALLVECEALEADVVAATAALVALETTVNAVLAAMKESGLMVADA